MITNIRKRIKGFIIRNCTAMNLSLLLRKVRLTRNLQNKKINIFLNSQGPAKIWTFIMFETVLSICSYINLFDFHQQYD